LRHAFAPIPHILRKLLAYKRRRTYFFNLILIAEPGDQSKSLKISIAPKIGVVGA
jgi:hypothetical protein